MRRPAFQMYPSEWLADPELNACCLAARGLWISACCVMHECKPYGHLTVNNRAMTDAEAATQCKARLQDYKKYMAELLTKGVAKRNGAGIIYSRRMVKDEALRSLRASYGGLSVNNPNVPRPKQQQARKDTPMDTLARARKDIQKTPEGYPPVVSPAIAIDSNSNLQTSSSVAPSTTGSAPVAWFTTQPGIVAKAKSIGLEIGAGESIESLRDRTRAALKNLQRSG